MKILYTALVSITIISQTPAIAQISLTSSLKISSQEADELMKNRKWKDVKRPSSCNENVGVGSQEYKGKTVYRTFLKKENRIHIGANLPVCTATNITF